MPEMPFREMHLRMDRERLEAVANLNFDRAMAFRESRDMLRELAARFGIDLKNDENAQWRPGGDHA